MTACSVCRRLSKSISREKVVENLSCSSPFPAFPLLYKLTPNILVCYETCGDGLCFRQLIDRSKTLFRQISNNVKISSDACL